MTDRQSTHGPDCWSWGPGHYDCAVREIERLRAEIEYEYEVWQGDDLQAGGRENDYASAQSEANHYAMMYAQDGPVEVRIYEKRLLSADKVQTERRPYNASGSLSEYGVFPECDAQQSADDELVFIDGVGAARRSVKSCRDGVQWIMVGDRVYWPLSDSDAKRLHSACCGNGSFDGPTTLADDALLRQVLEVLGRAPCGNGANP